MQGSPGRELLTTAQMYAADRGAIGSGTSGLALMEAAGAGVAAAIVKRWAAGRVAVLCGPGNNGGDGFVIARHLQQAGWLVRVALLGTLSDLDGDAASQARAWHGEVLELPAGTGADTGLPDDLLSPCDVIVDALFGAGLSRPLDGTAADLARAANASGQPVVAVDVPSGLSGDSGQPVGTEVVQATLTVTFFRQKPGHVLVPGKLYCGQVMCIPIGIPERVLSIIGPRLWENGPDLWRDEWRQRDLTAHKYRFGHALIAGGTEMTGAGRLAARAALRIGAGSVTVASAAAVQPIYAQASASLITAVAEDPEAFAALLRDARKNALLVGPGNGIHQATKARATAALQSGRATVLDADALSVFEDDPQELFGARVGPAVLTPHEGEFRRLFPDLADADHPCGKLDRARAAAARSGAVVILKGGDSVIAAPDGRAAINGNAPAELATAGSGDVLAGMTVGLLAQGLPAFEAAAAATWIHGASAQGFGPGLIADDLPERIPGALRKMHLDPR